PGPVRRRGPRRRLRRLTAVRPRGARFGFSGPGGRTDGYNAGSAPRGRPMPPALRLEPLEDRTTPAFGLDATFGLNGTVGVPHLELGGLVQQPDGRIVAAGRTNDAQFAVVRLNPDGSLDPTFGNGGVSTFPIGVF